MKCGIRDIVDLLEIVARQRKWLTDFSDGFVYDYHTEQLYIQIYLNKLKKYSILTNILTDTEISEYIMEIIVYEMVNNDVKFDKPIKFEFFNEIDSDGKTVYPNINIMLTPDFKINLI